MKFKKGDIIICTEPHSNFLTVGDLYTIIRVEITDYWGDGDDVERHVIVLDDNGNESGWYFDRFELYVKPYNLDEDLFVI